VVGGVVALVVREVVAPVAGGVVQPVVADLVTPVAGDVVASVAGAVVQPLVDDVLVPVVGDQLVAPLRSAIRPHVAPAVLGVRASRGGAVGVAPLASLVPAAGAEGLAVRWVGGGGGGHGRLSPASAAFPAGTEPAASEPAPMSAVPAGGAGQGSGSGSSGSSGVSAVLAGGVPITGPAPGGVVREREARPASLAHAPARLPG
jgi:hypothetical protein